MSLPDGLYFIIARESAHACAVGSNDVYETIRTLPSSHSPQPWRVTRTTSGTYMLAYCDRLAANVSDAAVALVFEEEQGTEWRITPASPRNLYIIQDRDTHRAWYALDRGIKDIVRSLSESSLCR